MSGKREKLKEISEKNKGTRKAILLDKNLNETKNILAKTLNGILRKSGEKPYGIVIDGTVTEPIIRAAEESDVQLIVAKNFSTIDTKIKLLSL